jgi:hypothetical protein
MLNSLTNQTAVIVILAVLTITGPALFFLLAQQAHAQNMTTAAATTSSPSGIKLSPQPIYQESSPPGNITPINQTHGILTFTGGGMLTLPNTTQTINTTHNGTAIISFTTSSGYGRETIRTQAGETVTATVYEIVQFNPATAPEGGGAPEEGGKGIVTAVFQTNSTGMLTPLNGVIAAGIDDMSPNGESHVTLWRWESGIPLPTAATTTTTPTEEPPLMNTTTTTTNVTTAETNATTAAAPEEGAEGGEEQQQQTTPTIPPAPNPLFE